MARRKSRTPNSRLAYCNKCKKPIEIGKGFYLGKRGKNFTDWYLHVECDELRQKQAAARKQKALEEKRAMEKKVLNQPIRLFDTEVKHPRKYGCGCTGNLPPA